MAAMWDRLRTGAGNLNGGSAPSAPPPKHGHSTIGGGGTARGAYYLGDPSVNNASNPPKGPSYSYSIQGGPAPPRPPREFLDHQLDGPPPVQGPPPRNPHRDTYRNSALRPTSSIYSQPSPVNTNFNAPPQHRRYTFESEEVSPPSSPEALPTRNGIHHPPSPDISPIDEHPGPDQMSQQQYSQDGPQSRSNIPMMRRERRHHQEAAARDLRERKSKERLRQPSQPEQILARRRYEGGEVRWDPNTGELTSTDKGRPSQVKPAEYAKGFGSSPSQQQQSRQADTSRGATMFGERMRKMAKTGVSDRDKEPLQNLQNNKSPTTTDPGANAFTADRPAWQGASGRTTLVAPVRDMPDISPLNIPRKSSKRAATSKSPTGAAGPRGGLDTIMASPPVSPPPGDETLGRETIRRVVPSSQLPKQPLQQAQAYPSPPLSSELSNRDSLQSQENPLSAVHQQHIKRKPAAHQQQDSVSSVYSQSDPYNYNHYKSSSGSNGTPPPPPPHQEWAQPPSRFSVTTYDATPRESLDEFAPHDAPPVPDLRSHPAAQEAGASVMDRRRPPKLGMAEHPIAFDEPIVISLNESWTSDTYKAKRDYKERTKRNPDAGSVHKVLPPAPPEQSAKDRVTQLNAQLAGLAQRRVNISRSIKQMTELMPTDNVLASAEVIHKREVEKLKVENLRKDLSEVQREEYELGLKLHRAYKRMDRDAEFEPTTLWVRRVTG